MKGVREGGAADPRARELERHARHVEPKRESIEQLALGLAGLYEFGAFHEDELTTCL